MNKIEDHQLILIVEDSDDDYEATIRAFKKSGNLKNPLHRCEDGEDAIAYLEQTGPYENDSSVRRPGIILMDLNMPGTDGRTALKQIKGNSLLKDIPVVVLTTSNDPLDIEACYKGGANTYIQKPVNLDGFFRAIKQLREYWFEIAILPKKVSR